MSIPSKRPRLLLAYKGSHVPLWWPKAHPLTHPSHTENWGERTISSLPQTLLCIVNGTEWGYPARFDGNSNPSSTLLSTARRWPNLSFESALNYTPKEISQQHAAHVLQWVAVQALMQCCFWQTPGNARSPGKFHRPKEKRKEKKKEMKDSGGSEDEKRKKQSGWFVKVSCPKPCSTRSHSAACVFVYSFNLYSCPSLPCDCG